MFFEILLLSVILVTGYVGPMMFRRLPPGHRAYAWMLIADLALAVIAFAGRQESKGDHIGDLLGAIAIGGAVCLVLVPPMLRDLARRALLGDRLKLALMLIDLRELLQPGMGARQERELVESILAVRSGRVEEAVGTLRDTRSKLASPLARRQIDERIVMTYLYARDWQHAINHYETHIDNPAGPISPQLLVEMVRAYCEAGDLEDAASLVTTLEESPLAHEPILAFLVNRARLVFLAFVGRTTAVDKIVAPEGPLGTMPRAAREFWSGIARKNAGDRTGARSSLTAAARLSGRDRRAKEIAEQTLSNLDTPGELGPHAVPPPVAELADKLTARATSGDVQAPPRTPRLMGVGWRSVPVTVGLVAANALAYALVSLLLGSTTDTGALVRAGANLKPAVAVGEYWRLPASMFLHVGLLHIFLNMYGLWILGRLVEQMFGRVRYFAIYMTAGLAGAAASFVFGSPGISAGASGAVFGVLGAAVAELALHRDAYPARWRGALLGNLIFLTLANVGIGFYYTAIDQSAHIGGLVAGLATAALLSPQLRFAKTMAIRVVAATLAAIGAASIIYAAGGVATTSYRDTLARYSWELVGQGPMVWEQPDPWPEVTVEPFAVVHGNADAALDQEAAAMQEQARKEGAEIEAPKKQIVEVPSPWRSRELVAVIQGVGGSQHLRLVLLARPQPGGLCWIGAVSLSEVLVPDVAPVLAEILDSVHQTGPAPQKKKKKLELQDL